MKRVALLTLLLCLCAPALAQTTLPYMYLWDKPNVDWSGLQPHASQMVRWYANVGTAQDVAVHVRNAAVQQIADGSTYNRFETGLTGF